jgi:hypothetical protein
VIHRRVVALAGATLTLAGCGTFGGGVVPENAAIVRFVNATSFAVEVRVNGAPRGVIQPWTPVQELAVLGPDGPPWQVEFFDPGGLQLAGLEVDGPARPGEGSASSQSSSCGIFSVWWGLEPDHVPVVDAGATRPPSPPCN